MSETLDSRISDSAWRTVTKGYSTGSVLGPFLFDLSLSDLEKGMEDMPVRSVDNDKLW